MIWFTDIFLINTINEPYNVLMYYQVKKFIWYILIWSFFRESCVADVGVHLPPPNMQFISTEMSKEVTTRTELNLQKLGHLANLHDFYTPAEVGYKIPVNFVATNGTFNKAILAAVGFRANPDYFEKLYRHKKGFFTHKKIAGTQASIFFLGFSEAEVQVLFSQFEKAYSAKNKLITREIASELATGEDSENSNSTRKTIATHIYAFGGDLKGCLQGIADGATDPFVSFAKSSYLLATNPDQFWDNSVGEWNALTNVIKNGFANWLKEQKINFNSLPSYKKSGVYCSFLGASGTGAAIGKFSKAILTTSKIHYHPIDWNAVEKSIQEASVGNLRNISRGTREFAEASNKRVIRGLNDEPITLINPKKQVGLSKEKAAEVLKKVHDNPVSSYNALGKYDTSGTTGFCFGRALATHLELLKAGVQKESIRKIWAIGNLKNGSRKWGHHVATAVRAEDGSWIVLDPNYQTPLRLETWVTKVKNMDVEGNMRIFQTDANRFGPEPRIYNRTDLGLATKGNPQPDDFYNGYFKDLMETMKKEAASLGALTP